MARELNRQLQELQIQLKRNRAKIAEDAQQLEVVLVLMLLVVLTLKILSIAEDAQQQVEGCRCQC